MCRSAWAGSGRQGRFLNAVLRSRISVEPGADVASVDALHHEVHRYCFIARSVNFPVIVEATDAEERAGAQAAASAVAAASSSSSP